MFSSSLFASNVNCRRPSSSMLLRHPCILPPSTATAYVASPSQRHSLLVNSLAPHDNDDSIDNDSAAATITMKTMDLLSKQLQSNKTTIQEVLHTSLQILSESSNNNNIIIHEPTESVLHLLSYALKLSWEDGFCQLREILTLPTPQLSSSSRSSSSSISSSNVQYVATQTLTTDQLNNYLSYIQRRLQHEPIQYIVGKWDFHHLIGLKVHTPMLCPRSETEELVELVLDDIGHLIHDINIGHEELEQQQQQQRKSNRRRRIRVLDVGCGTGAIGIAIAYAYPQHVQVVAIDISSEAIKLSNENANYFLSSTRRANEEEELEDGVGCLYSAILCPANDYTNSNKEGKQSTLSLGTELWEMDFDIIVSNPPYIPMKEMASLTKDVINYESYDALCGGNDGLDVVRDIIHRLPEWTYPTMIDDKKAVLVKDTNTHTPRYCWMEVDDTHPNILEEWLSPGSMESIRHGVEYCDRRKDCFGRDRFVKFRVC